MTIIDIQFQGKTYSIDADNLSASIEKITALLKRMHIDPGSQGLAYLPSADGTYYCVEGIGTCTDTDIIIPSSHEGLPVTKIYGNGFQYKTHITSIIIPETVTYIISGAFFYCTGLTSITIPSGIKEIYANTFDYCTNLVNINFNGTMEQWDAIVKADKWAKDIHAFFVQCTDGQVSLK